MEKVLDKVSLFSFYLLLFLLPLFFLPLTFDILEINKLFLFFFLILISIIFWFLKFVFRKEIKIKKSLITLFLILFLFIGGISTFFSVDRHFSIFGFPQRYSQGFFSFLLFFLLYFFISNLREKEDKKFFNFCFSILIISSLIIEITTLFSIFGIWKYLKISLFQGMVFNQIGSLESLCFFLVSLLPLYIYNLMEIDLKERKKLLLNIISLSLALFIISISGIREVEIVLALSLILFLVLSLFSKIYREKIERLLLPLSILIVILVFLFSNFSILPFQKEAKLSLKDSWKISISSVLSNVKFAILGSGPSTFFYDFLKFKDKEINQTSLWTIRFNRSSSHLSEILSSFGILGFLFFILFITSSLKIGISVFFKEKRSEFLTIFVVFANLVLTSFLYYQNMTISFLFWVFAGFLVKEGEKKTINLSFKKIPELSLLFGAIAIVLIIGFIFGFWKIFNIWRADYYFSKSQKTSDISERIDIQQKILRFYPNSSYYKTILGNNFLARIQIELQKPQKEQDQNLILNSFQNAIFQLKGGYFERNLTENLKIKGAVELSPNWVFPQESLAIVYREINFLSGDKTAERLAIEFFQKAINLEPTNPVLHTELGKMYLNKRELDKAKEEFEKAIDLKKDYYDAKVQLALVFERKGDNDKAIETLKEVLSQNPNYINAIFNLGRIYYNQNEIDLAISQFENVLFLFPNHSNSLLSLAFCYEKKGDKEKAIQYLEKVLELNPDNLEIKNKLEELKGEKE